MSTSEFLLIYLGVLLTMLACRCIPILLLKGRELPERVTEILALIQPAAFAALVANDLFSSDMLGGDVLDNVLPFVAAAVVVVVARRTRSLVWSAVTGIAAYGALLLAFGLL